MSTNKHLNERAEQAISQAAIELAEQAVYHHAALHMALPVATVKDGDRIDPDTKEVIHGNGAVLYYKDVNRIPSNLFNKESHSDRLLDHYLANKEHLDGKCCCPNYESLLRLAPIRGDNGDYMSLHRRLIAKVCA